MRKLALLMLALVCVAGAQAKPLILSSGKVWVKGQTVQLLNKAGKRVWSTQISDEIFDLLSAQGKVLLNYWTGITALDAKTGRVIWKIQMRDIRASVNVHMNGPARGWGVVGNKVYWSSVPDSFSESHVGRQKKLNKQ